MDNAVADAVCIFTDATAEDDHIRTTQNSGGTRDLLAACRNEVLDRCTSLWVLRCKQVAKIARQPRQPKQTGLAIK